MDKANGDPSSSGIKKIFPPIAVWYDLPYHIIISTVSITFYQLVSMAIFIILLTAHIFKIRVEKLTTNYVIRVFFIVKTL